MQFWSLITLNLATGFYLMLKKGCWPPSRMPDPSFHGGMLKKTSSRPKVGSRADNPEKRRFCRKRRSIPLGHRTHECVCVSAHVCEVHTTVVFCTLPRCGGRRANMCTTLGRAGVCLTSLLKKSNKGFFCGSGHFLGSIRPHAFTK